ncbi:MAG: ATP-binding protein [Acidobacteriota bacterium]|nr:ATP-binding protein [Acidobacteriota bacterium]MDH3785108.1 ATP-binding protein [Acidobacteriota bacterium]
MGLIATCSKDVALVGKPSRAAFLHGLIDGMRCGVLAVGSDGRIALINEIGRHALDLADHVEVGDPMNDALRPHPQLVDLLKDSFILDQLPNRAEIPLHPGRADGKTLGFTLSHIRDDQGHVTGTAMFFKDLTPIEHREEQERLQERLAAVGQMAASLAHEIRNPLASIGVSCKLVGRRLNSEGMDTDLIDKINGELARLNHTVTSCLEFVRPVALQFTNDRIEPVLQDALTIARERSQPDRLEINTRFGEGLSPLRMDVTLLRQVFENLILNAIEAMDGRGTIEIEAERVPASSSPSVPYRPAVVGRGGLPEAKEFLVVTVSDSGPGIDEDLRESIFFPFFTTKPQGSGVGLSVVRKFVDSHSGAIAVDRSQLGGARFTLRLPLITMTEEESIR